MNELNHTSQLSDSLRSAIDGDENAFSSITEPFRGEIQTHCYRMLGSLEDAEDLVQETFLRAWRWLDTFQGRGTYRAWLYKIATNACLDTIKRQPRRTLPTLMGPPTSPHLPIRPPILEPIWVQPYPDEWVAPLENSPEARYTVRESISLAFTVALQVLPARQRCALILADVLEWSAEEIAALLETSVSAVNSLLHRARGVLKDHYKAGEPVPEEPTSNHETQSLLERYLQAWEAADIQAIVALLAEDAHFPMPPLPGWYLGRQAIGAFIAATSLAGDAAQRWRLLPMRANRQPGIAFYQLDATRLQYFPFALQVLRLREPYIGEAVTFGFPHLFKRFGLPESLPEKEL